MREQGISSKDKSTINVYLLILFMHGRSLNKYQKPVQNRQKESILNQYLIVFHGKKKRLIDVMSSSSYYSPSCKENMKKKKKFVFLLILQQNFRLGKCNCMSALNDSFMILKRFLNMNNSQEILSLRTRKFFHINTGNLKSLTTTKRPGCVLYCLSHFCDFPTVKKGIQT